MKQLYASDSSVVMKDKLPEWPEKESFDMGIYSEERHYYAELAEAALARMEDLMEYAQHAPSCGIGGTVGGKPTGCTCGLDALLAACVRRSDG